MSSAVSLNPFDCISSMVYPSSIESNHIPSSARAVKGRAMIIMLSKKCFICLIIKVKLFNKCFQFPVQHMNGQSHHIKIAANDLLHADVPDPFLDSVGPGFIVWLILSNIIIYLFFRKRSKPDFGSCNKRGTFCW